MEQNISYRPKINVIEEAYTIPQLDRTRRIAALLPYDYDRATRRYPVLFLHDGQNLYDKDAPFGNWGADVALEKMAQEGNGEVIIIAIDHGDEERITEYLPYDHPKFGKGEGSLYLEFLTETLKPYVDQHFRTLPDREHTGVGGSSMGGLISLAAGTRHADIFEKMMIFSPSLWINPEIFEEVAEHIHTLPTDVYLYAGGKESKNHLANIRRLKAAFLRNKPADSLLRYTLSINPEGMHSEYFWGQEFPKALEWLFFVTPNSDSVPDR